jgi:hypothetical protein
MQNTGLAGHALTIHINSARPQLRIAIDPPAIEHRNGDVVLTIGLSMTWESNDAKSGGENPMGRDSTSDELAPESESFPCQGPPLFPVPTRFRNWYLCARDGAEWSVEVDDPTMQDSCPICGTASSAIAVLGLPLDLGSRSKGAESKLKLCRSLGTFYRN